MVGKSLAVKQQELSFRRVVAAGICDIAGEFDDRKKQRYDEEGRPLWQVPAQIYAAGVKPFTAYLTIVDNLPEVDSGDELEVEGAELGFYVSKLGKLVVTFRVEKLRIVPPVPSASVASPVPKPPSPSAV